MNRINKKAVTSITVIVLLFSMFLFVSGKNGSETNVATSSTDVVFEVKSSEFSGLGTEANSFLISSIAGLKNMRDELGSNAITRSSSKATILAKITNGTAYTGGLIGLNKSHDVSATLTSL